MAAAARAPGLMPADPPRVLDDAVGLDAALIARQATEYDALSGDLTGGTDAQNELKRSVARRLWAGLAAAVNGCPGAMAVLSEAGGYAPAASRVLNNDEHDVQHDILGDNS